MQAQAQAQPFSPSAYASASDCLTAAALANQPLSQCAAAPKR
jgi:hypothetical protein